MYKNKIISNSYQFIFLLTVALLGCGGNQGNLSGSNQVNLSGSNQGSLTSLKDSNLSDKTYEAIVQDTSLTINEKNALMAAVWQAISQHPTDKVIRDREIEKALALSHGSQDLALTLKKIADSEGASLAAGQLKITTRDKCFGIQANITNDTLDKERRNNITNLLARYQVIKKFEAGKGGAWVSLVKDVLTDKKVVLKIFPSIVGELSETFEFKSPKYSYRELFYTCLNGFISYEDLGINSDSHLDVGPFPRAFEIGITNAPKLANIKDGYLYPYMVIELVEGKSLADLAENGTMLTSVQFKLQRAGLSRASRAEKTNSELAILELIQIARRLKTLTISGRAYDFHHLDTNVGNIFIRNKSFSGTIDFGPKKIPVKDGPLVALIDLGHSSSSLDPDLGPNIDMRASFIRKLLHRMSDSTIAFAMALTGKGRSLFDAFYEGAFSTNPDTSLLRTIIQAFYDSGNYIHEDTMKALSKCTKLRKCIETVPIKTYTE